MLVSGALRKTETIGNSIYTLLVCVDGPERLERSFPQNCQSHLLCCSLLRCTSIDAMTQAVGILDVVRTPYQCVYMCVGICRAVLELNVTYLRYMCVSQGNCPWKAWFFLRIFIHRFIQTNILTGERSSFSTNLYARKAESHHHHHPCNHRNCSSCSLFRTFILMFSVLKLQEALTFLTK